MPPKFAPIAAITHGFTRSALLALTLAGLVAALAAISVPNATAGADDVAPSTPQNLRVFSATQTSLILVWDAATDDVAVDGYKIWFGQPTPTKPLDHQPSVKTVETRFTATELGCGRSYQVEVRAFDRARNLSAAMKSVVSTAPCVDVQAPLAPSGLQQIAASPTSATLAWSRSTDNVAVAGYSLSRAGIELDTTSETSYSFIGLGCGKTYAVAVRAYDVARNYSGWVGFYVTAGSCGDVSAPTAPAGVVQTNMTVSGMSLAWSASKDNVGVARYDVFRDGALAGSATGVSYSLSGLSCAKSYTVGLEAVDGAGNRSARTSATMSTAPCVTPPPPTNDTQPPSTPTNLGLAAASATSVTLSWSPSVDNVGVTGYGAVLDGAPVQVVTGTTFVFQGLSCGTSHRLGVRAYDAKGNHSGLASVAASTGPCSDSSPPTMPQNLVVLSRTSASVTVNWSASTDMSGVAGYGAYVDGQLDGSTSTTSYTFTGLACDTSFSLGVDAFDAAGNRSAKANLVVRTPICNDTQAPTAPLQLTVSNETQTDLTLTWAASSDNGSVGGYDVFANGVKTATVVATEHTFGGLACGTAYIVGVEAFDISGNRSTRKSVTASTAPCAPPPPPSGGGSLFVAPNGSDSSSCTQSSPCRSFDRAYKVATPGAVVVVAGGSFPVQTMTQDASKTAATQSVIFQPAPGASVTLAGFTTGDNGVTADTGADNLELRDMTINAEVFVRRSSLGITFRNVTMRNFTFNSPGTRFLGGSVGPFVDKVATIVGCPLCPAPSNILIDGVRFHDFTVTDPSKHAECMQIWPTGATNITVRNSIFQNCTDFGVLVKAPGSSNFTFENNFFDIPMPGSVSTASCSPNCPRAGNSLRFSSYSYPGSVVRYNTFLGGLSIFDNTVATKGNLVNVDPSWVVDGATADGTMDLHLRSGSPAIGLGDPADYPGRDLDGEGRPQGGVPDAGADERT